MKFRKLFSYSALIASVCASLDAADAAITFVETGTVELMAGMDYEVEAVVTLPPGAVAAGVTIESVSLFDNKVLLAEMEDNSGSGSWTAPVPNINPGRHHFTVLVIDSEGDQSTGDASTLNSNLFVDALPLDLTVDFGPEGYAPGAGISLDTGLSIGARAVTSPVAGDFYYGWSRSLSIYSGVEGEYAGSPSSSDVAWDSYRSFRSSEGYEADWELQVPDGVYLVDLWLGDSSYGAEEYELLIEGESTGILKTKTGNGYEGWHAQATKVVHVEDGMLTLSDPGNELPAKLNRLSIRQVYAPNEDSLKYLNTFSYGINLTAYDEIWVAALGSQRGVSKPKRSITGTLDAYIDYLNILSDPWATELKVFNGALIPPDESTYEAIGDLQFYKSDLALSSSYWTRSVTGTFAYFGEQFGGSPLLQNVPYAFFLNPGTLGALSGIDSEIRIQVYSKTDYSHVGTKEIDLDDLILASGSLSDDERDALLAGLTVEIEAYGLHTTLGLSRQNGDESPEFMVWHRAENANYIYVIETNSSVDETLSSSATKTLAFDGTTLSLGADQFTPVYTLSFSEVSRSGESTEVQKNTAFGDSLLPFYLVGKGEAGAATATQQNLASALMDYAGEDLSAVSDASDSLMAPFHYLPNSEQPVNEIPASSVLTPELRQHSALDEFVEKYNYDAIALTNFVFNEIELIDEMSYNQSPEPEISLDPGGVQRSALGVFLEKKGSPTEQCALLVYFLRKCGIPAGYASGERNKLLLDTDLLSSILRINLNQYRDVPDQVPVNYPWVVAFVDEDGEGGADGEWVHLFPWLKDIEVSEGFDLFSLMPDEYNTAWEWVMGYFQGDENILPFRFDDTDQTIKNVWAEYGDTDPGELPSEYRALEYASDYDQPFALFPRFVEWKLREEGLDVNLDEDVGMQYRYRNNYFARWQDFPEPSYFDGDIDVIAGLDEIPNIFDTIEYRIYGANFDVNGEESQKTGPLIETGTINVCDLHNRKLIVENLPRSGGSATKDIALNMGAYDTSDATVSVKSWPLPSSVEDLQAFQIAAQKVESSAQSHSLQRTVLHIVRRKNRSYVDVYNILQYTASAGASIWFGFDDTRFAESTLSGGRQKLDYEWYWQLDEGVYAICNNFGTVSREMLKQHGQEMTEYERSGASGDSDIERDTRIYLMGMQYWEYTSRFKQEMARLLKVRYINDSGMMLAGLDVDDGANPVFPKVDIFQPVRFGYLLNGTFDLGKNISSSDANRDFFHLVGCQGSAYEHGAINKYFGQLGAVSTMRVFHLAKERGDPLYLVSKDDWPDLSMKYDNSGTSVITIDSSFKINHEQDGRGNENFVDSDLYREADSFFSDSDDSGDMVAFAPRYYKYYEKTQQNGAITQLEMAGVAPIPYFGTMGGTILGDRFQYTPQHTVTVTTDSAYGDVKAGGSDWADVVTITLEGHKSLTIQTRANQNVDGVDCEFTGWSNGSDSSTQTLWIDRNRNYHASYLLPQLPIPQVRTAETNATGAYQDWTNLHVKTSINGASFYFRTHENLGNNRAPGFYHERYTTPLVGEQWYNARTMYNVNSSLNILYIFDFRAEKDGWRPSNWRYQGVDMSGQTGLSAPTLPRQ